MPTTMMPSSTTIVTTTPPVVVQSFAAGSSSSSFSSPHDAPQVHHQGHQDPSSSSCLLPAPKRVSHHIKLPSDFQPGQWTVICGRGKMCTDSPGNVYLRKLVNDCLLTYSKATNKKQKSDIVTTVMECIKSKNALTGGAFVKESSSNDDHDNDTDTDTYTFSSSSSQHPRKVWWEVDESFAREKIGCMFRDMLHTQYKSSTKAKHARSKTIKKQQKKKKKQQQQGTRRGTTCTTTPSPVMLIQKPTVSPGTSPPTSPRTSLDVPQQSLNDSLSMMMVELQQQQQHLQNLQDQISFQQQGPDAFGVVGHPNQNANNNNNNCVSMMQQTPQMPMNVTMPNIMMMNNMNNPFTVSSSSSGTTTTTTTTTTQDNNNMMTMSMKPTSLSLIQEACHIVNNSMMNSIDDDDDWGAYDVIPNLDDVVDVDVDDRYSGGVILDEIDLPDSDLSSIFD